MISAAFTRRRVHVYGARALPGQTFANKVKKLGARPTSFRSKLNSGYPSIQRSYCTVRSKSSGTFNIHA